MACGEEKDIRKVLKHYRDNYCQYVKDFVFEQEDEFVHDATSRSITVHTDNSQESPR